MIYVTEISQWANRVNSHNDLSSDVSTINIVLFIIIIIIIIIIIVIITSS